MNDSLIWLRDLFLLLLDGHGRGPLDLRFLGLLRPLVAIPVRACCTKTFKNSVSGIVIYQKTFGRRLSRHKMVINAALDEGELERLDRQSLAAGAIELLA